MGHAGCPRFAWIALAATVAGLAVAGDRVVWAAPAEMPKQDCLAGTGPAAARLTITLGATLTGTVLVDEGRSLALFEPIGGTGLMHEGDAFADGTPLCEVRVDRIVVGRGASRREVFLGSKGQPTVTASPRYAGASGQEVATGVPVFAPETPQPAVAGGDRPGVQPAGRASLMDIRAANFHAMLERRLGQSANE